MKTLIKGREEIIKLLFVYEMQHLSTGSPQQCGHDTLSNFKAEMLPVQKPLSFK